MFVQVHHRDTAAFAGAGSGTEKKGLYAGIRLTRRTRFPTSDHARTPFSAALPAFQQNRVFIPLLGIAYLISDISLS